MEDLPAPHPPDTAFVEFNAWLYQGYDDARSALMEVIGTKLLEYAEVSADRASS
jgi:predicted KAP-like P-loop ATPase